MSFDADLAAFAATCRRREQAVFVNTANAVLQSIKEGSPITSSPGQPVDTANLKNSWQLEFESATVALVATNVAYAPVIEHNLRSAYEPSGKDRAPLQPGQKSIKSTVGGHHSVKLTTAGFRRLVEDETRKVNP